MKPKAIVCWCVVSLVQCTVYAQNVTTDSVLATLERYAGEYPQEKVYLHLDKPYYTVGDDIWFKGYVTIGPYNNLSGLSKILYVDFINPADEIVQSIRLPLIAGVTMGDFRLADSLMEGNYRIRAYSNWMRNFDSDIFYDRTLPIGNARSDNIITHSSFSYDNSSATHAVNTEITFTDLKGGPLADMSINYQVIMESRNIGRGREKTNEIGQIAFGFENKQPFNLKNGKVELAIQTPEKQTISKTIPLKATSNENSIRFFPESGHLVAGNLTKVGFKALRSEGLGVGVTGYLADGDGTRITEFESVYAGMGSFSFIPQAGQRYTATVIYEDGTEIQEDFPEVASSGYALAVNNELEKNIFVQAFASSDLVEGQEITLMLQRNANVFYASKSKFVKNEMVFSIPRENIPAGLIQLTLFSPTMQPLAERTLFNANESALLPITLSADKEIYGAREKATMRIAVDHAVDSGYVAVLSASVIDLARVPLGEYNDGNIYASLLLSADIKGYIETPEYYFEDIDISKKRQLDNLMLTQGWSRINWRDLMAGKTPSITYHPEQDLRISGVVTKRDGKTPVPKAKVTILSTSDISAVIDTVTGDDGRFNFDRLLFYDNTRFLVQARDERGRRNVEVQLDESPKLQVTRNRNAPDATVNVNQSISTYLKNTQEQFQEMERYGLKERTILLEEVKVTREVDKSPTRHSSNLNGPGRADQIIVADELMMGCPTLDICLQGRLLGVIFRNGMAYSTRSAGMSDLPMQIVLDGMFMEAEALSIINPFDVETVEVLRRPENTAIYGMRGGGGVLVITTKRGDSGAYGRDLHTPGIATHSPQGYYEVREFYAPDYSVPVDSLEGMRDLRTTIHWEPHLVTDSDGNTSFEFYTAESGGTYRIVVEGLDVDGRLGRAVHYITVK